MSKNAPEHLAQDWLAMLAETDAQALRTVRSLAVEQQNALASAFYEQMLQHSAASRLLSLDQVRTRLQASMMRWVASVFSASSAGDVQASVAQQQHVGAVHARIDVPVHLVLRGARCLKSHLFGLLLQTPALTTEQAGSAQRYVSNVIDLCMEAMSQAYHTHHDREARSSEAYRLHAVAHNLGTERERQRAALLDWENSFMFERAMGRGAQDLPRLGASEFGLWFHHKGTHAFQGTPELALIEEALQFIDSNLLPQFAKAELQDAGAQHALLRQLRERCKAVAFHLDTLFEQNQALDAGRDVLTQLLNRKFLPVVMGKEVRYARERDSSFAVLVIDIDYFKSINDQYGHAGGDAVLQQMAAILTNMSRGGDYAFRLGGEEFLLLLVDISLEQAVSVAERLREKVALEQFRLPLGRVEVTVSVGLAMDGGHPDYEQVVRRADEALYRAKAGGRNRVVVAD